MIDDTLLSCLRCVLIAGISVSVSSLVARLIRDQRSGWKQAVLLVTIWLPLLTPSLLTAYSYGRWTLSLIHHPIAKEALYTGLVLLKFSPIAVLILWLFPPVASAISSHTFGMAQPPGRLRFKWLVRRLAGASAIAFGAVFFFSFHEFELASLLGIETWPVQLFDAHAGGVSWSDTLRLAAPALVVQLVFVIVLVLCFRSLPGAVAETDYSVRRLSPLGCGAAWVWTTTCALGVTVLPLLIVSPQAAEGFSATLRSFALQKEVLASSLFGISGGFLVWWLSRFLSGRTALASALPGLMGPLAVALLAVVLFQNGPAAIYDSPLPLVLVLVMVFMPIGVLMQRLVRRTAESPAAFIGKNLAGHWKPTWIGGGGRAQFYALALLIIACWFEVTASAILAPPGMTTTATRLHNLMHYGQMATLSAMTVVSLAVPFVTVWAIYFACRSLVRFHDARC